MLLFEKSDLYIVIQLSHAQLDVDVFTIVELYITIIIDGRVVYNNIEAISQFNATRYIGRGVFFLFLLFFLLSS